MTIRLFVYGTLKRGGCRHGPLATQRYLGEVATKPIYLLYNLGDYPGLVVAATEGATVHGELYDVERSLIPWLDAVEGSPHWFKLSQIELTDGEAWAYVYQGDPTGRPTIPSGRWENWP